MIVAGLWLVAGAFLGGARWLILPALALALPAGVVSAGEHRRRRRRRRPRSTARSTADHVRDEYQLGVGQPRRRPARRAELPPGDRRMHVDVGVGRPCRRRPARRVRRRRRRTSAPAASNAVRPRLGRPRRRLARRPPRAAGHDAPRRRRRHRRRRARRDATTTRRRRTSAAAGRSADASSRATRPASGRTCARRGRTSRRSSPAWPSPRSAACCSLDRLDVLDLRFAALGPARACAVARGDPARQRPQRAATESPSAGIMDATHGHAPAAHPRRTRPAPRPRAPACSAACAPGSRGHLGVDPLLVRVAFVAAGDGGRRRASPLYLLRWVVLPAGRRRRPAPRGCAPGRADGRGRARGRRSCCSASCSPSRAIGLWFSDAIVWPLVLVAGGRRAALAPVARRRLPGTGPAGAAPAGGGRGRGHRRRGTRPRCRPRRARRPSAPRSSSRTGLGVALVIAAGARVPQATGALERRARRRARRARRRGRRSAVIFAPWVAAARALAGRRARRADPLAGARRDGRAPARLRPADARARAAARRRPARRSRRSPAARSASCARGSSRRAPGRRGEPPTLGGRARGRRRARSSATTASPSRSSRSATPTLDAHGEALVAAAREAMVNAAKFGGGAPVDVYAEARRRRDRRSSSATAGPGFDPGGGARPTAAACASRSSGAWRATAAARTIHSAPGAGTEVELDAARGARRERPARRAARRDRRRPRALPRRRARRARGAASTSPATPATVDEAVRAHRRASGPTSSCSTSTCPTAAASRSSAAPRPQGDRAALPRAVGLRRRRGRHRRHPRGRARLRDEVDLAGASSPTRSGACTTATPSSPRGSPGFVLDAFAGAPPRAAAPRPATPSSTSSPPREREVLRHLARGYMYKEIALRLGDLGQDRRGPRLGRAAQAPALQPPRAVALGGRAAARGLTLRTHRQGGTAGAGGHATSHPALIAVPWPCSRRDASPWRRERCRQGLGARTASSCARPASARVIVDAKGRAALPLPCSDRTGPEARCSGACAAAWPPAPGQGATPTVGKGLAKRKVGTTRRADGTPPADRTAGTRCTASPGRTRTSRARSRRPRHQRLRRPLVASPDGQRAGRSRSPPPRPPPRARADADRRCGATDHLRARGAAAGATGAATDGSPALMFEKVLVANRGEIAVRVIRALDELGIASVAVYSELDRDALHVRRADEAYLLGGAAGGRELPQRREDPRGRARGRAPRRSTPATASWPRTRPSRAACEEAGIVFIGPPASAIEAMGSKTRARELMRGRRRPDRARHDRAGRDRRRRPRGSSTTTSATPSRSRRRAAAAARASASRSTSDELQAAFEGASREGEKFFSDPTVYLERYLPDPRHVEVQVLADAPRQRHPPRRARLLGPAPPPEAHRGVARRRPSTTALRERIGDDRRRRRARGRLRRRGHDRGPALQDGEYFFLEMNTRVQVEHCVTEMTTGVDIVKEGIRAAAGEPLTVAQDDVVLRGHAIECRINAEDAAKQLRPRARPHRPLPRARRPGRARRLGRRAGQRDHARCTTRWCAKLIVWDADREQATARMLRALGEYEIEGLKTLIPFHAALLRTSQWRDGETCRDLVEDQRRGSSRSRSRTPAEGRRTTTRTTRSSTTYTVEVSGRRFDVKVIGPPRRRRRSTARRPRRPPPAPARPRRADAEGAAAARAATRSTPRCRATCGRSSSSRAQTVEEGQLVCIIEAMKMENEITAHKAGDDRRAADQRGRADRRRRDDRRHHLERLVTSGGKVPGRPASSGAGRRPFGCGRSRTAREEVQ